MLLAVQVTFIKLINGKKTCTEHNPEAKGKKKVDCLESKPPFILHTFPGAIKYKEPREAWIKALRQEPFEKKGHWQPVQVIESFFLLSFYSLFKADIQNHVIVILLVTIY